MPFKLKPAVSAVAVQALDAACKNLEITIPPEESQSFNTMTLEHVKQTALTIEDQLAARKSLRNMRRLLPLFTGLDHYAKIIGTLCIGTQYLPWMWAPIALILRTACEHIEAFETIVKGYSRIADALVRFKTLDTALGIDPDFQMTLAGFYTNILLFHEHAYNFVHRKSWKLLFSTSWGRFEKRFDNMIDEMKRHEKLVDLQANARGIAEIREMRENIKSWREDSLAKEHKWHAKEATKQYESIMAWLKSEESDQLALLDTISSEGNKFRNTCSWILNHTKMQTWRQQSPDLPVLWLKGTPGSGKSVLASQIIHYIKQREDNMFLIHYFCSQRYSSSTTYEQILRSILLQLLHKDDDLIAHVYENCVLKKKAPTVQALEKLLLNLFATASRSSHQFEYIWIIIDGLNECSTHGQIRVSHLINQLTSKLSGTGGTICKVLVSSRHSQDIANKLRAAQVISLSQEKKDVKLAIRQYVSLRLQAMHKVLAQLELKREDIDEIERRIANKADGMFLYARLVLDYLSKNIFISGKEINKSIDELPEELSDFYQKILAQILAQLDERSVKRIQCIFSWIAFAKRPLKRIEFLSALTFSFGDHKITNLVPRYILDVCGALVEERSDTTWTFIHVSVKEYLTTGKAPNNIGISEDEALTQHCLSTLTCLFSGIDVFLGDEPPDRHSKVLRVVKGLHGFHVYATEYWAEYLLLYISKPSATDSVVLDLASKFAENLHQSTMTMITDDLDSLSFDSDGRTASLEQWPHLRRLIEAFLRERSPEGLESKLEREHQKAVDAQVMMDLDTPHQENGTIKQNFHDKGLEKADGISLMLSSYQEIVRFLLDEDEYPGISADDLAMFKSQFQSSAFTCRFRQCPRATKGFESEQLRRQHEIAHTRLPYCTVPECRYPLFRSPKALKSHIAKYHCQEPCRRPLRRKGNIASHRTQWNDDTKAGTRHSLLLRDSASDNGKRAFTSDPIMSTDELKINQPSAAKRHAGSSEGMKVHQEPNEKHADRDLGLMEDIGSQMDESGIDTINLDEILHVAIDSIGYRACSISNCYARLEGDSLGEPFYPGVQEPVSLHYWNYHHTDSFAQCAVSRCRMVFASNQGLQAHYEQRHTTLFCQRCEANYPDGFALEDELRHHWRYAHLRMVKKWICSDPSEGGRYSPLIRRYEACASCTQKHRFDRSYDAIKHLKTEHFGISADTLHAQEPLYRFIGSCVKMVQIYEEIEAEYIWKDIRATATDGEESDEEDSNLDNSMFYVPELA